MISRVRSTARASVRKALRGEIDLDERIHGVPSRVSVSVYSIQLHATFRHTSEARSDRGKHRGRRGQGQSQRAGSAISSWRWNLFLARLDSGIKGNAGGIFRENPRINSHQEWNGLPFELPGSTLWSIAVSRVATSRGKLCGSLSRVPRSFAESFKAPGSWRRRVYLGIERSLCP